MTDERLQELNVLRCEISDTKRGIESLQKTENFIQLSDQLRWMGREDFLGDFEAIKATVVNVLEKELREKQKQFDNI